MTLSGLWEVPYYAVIFASLRTDGEDGYGAMSEEMARLAAVQSGYLGIDSARSGVGITVSYWRSPEDIRAWKSNLDHADAQRKGKEKWYSRYTVRVAKVEYNYEFGNEELTGIPKRKG